MREYDGDPGENFTKLSNFLENTQVSPLDEILMRQGEKESFDLALLSLAKMGLADDSAESKFLRTKPQVVLRDFITKLQSVRRAYAQGNTEKHREIIKELQTFFNNVISANYNAAAANRPRGCFW